MQNFDIIRKSSPTESFRVKSVMGTYDLQSRNIEERFTGSFELPKEWQIGIIVGNSGTGKTTIAKELFTDNYITEFDYSADNILDDMPKEKTVTEIVRAFNSVGFSSVPSWLKSYHVLSNGEKMRVDLARAMLENKDLFVFDEFTSVVDRDVAKVGSLAIQKAIRKTNKQFIAVGCHFDVIDWLMPDWVFNTNDMTFQSFEGQKKKRPTYELEIYETKAKTAFWKMFSKYHYLSHSLNKAGRVYILTWNGVVCGFCSVLPFPHPKKRGFWKEHRTVVLPDFQGIGLGSFLSNNVAEILKSEGKGFISTSSNPAFINARKKSDKWIITRVGRTSRGSNTGGIHNKHKKGSTSSNRITVSFQYVG